MRAGRGGRRTFLGRMGAVVALAMLTVLASASLATAHDRLVASAPADGEILAEPPEAVVLTFSAEILPISPAVVVRDAAGTVVADEEPTIDGTVASAPLPSGLGPGAYTVTWRVVSQDGHPIEGSFGFTVEVGATSPTPADSPTGAATTTSVTATATPSASPSPGPQAGAGVLPPWARLALAIGATGAVAAAAIGAARRRRQP